MSDFSSTTVIPFPSTVFHFPSTNPKLQHFVRIDTNTQLNFIAETKKQAASLERNASYDGHWATDPTVDKIEASFY